MRSRGAGKVAALGLGLTPRRTPLEKGPEPRRRRLPAAAFGQLTLAALPGGRRTRGGDGERAGRGWALGSHSPAHRCDSAGRSQPGGGAALGERAAAGGGATAEAVGEPASRYRPHLGTSSPPGASWSPGSVEAA